MSPYSVRKSFELSLLPVSSYMMYSFVFCFGGRNIILPSPAPEDAAANRKKRRAVVDSNRYRDIG
jgi:hypothetical protein